MILSLVGLLIICGVGYYLIRANKKDENTVTIGSIVFPEMVHAESVEIPEQTKVTGKVTIDGMDATSAIKKLDSKLSKKKTTKKKAKSKKRK